jgi:asparagine N-glycosylation enzyme membrane subunit Stt3
MISSQKAKEYYNWTIFSIIGLGFLGVLSSSLFNLFIYKLILGILVLFFGVLSVYGISKQELLKKVDFSLILIFSLFFLSIISARGSVRTIMVLVPAASITSAYLLVSLFDDSRKIGENYKLFVWIIGAIISLGLLISGFQFYQQSIYLGENNVKVPLPNGQMTLDIVYAQQWQKAMGWVRNNTINEAVFAHWWDYGYWVQSLGERATVLDGGNAYAYWDYLMGRYALTGKSNQEALEFLYSHNVTHFLIDSTDIGKYTAFSSIGSDENYDRFSSIQTFSRADQETVETKNSVKTIYYPGQKGTIIPLESDLTYTLNETKIFLPAGKSGVIAIIIEKNSSGLMQPYGIFYYQGNQYLLPLRYGYSSSLTDFNSGVQSGIFLFPIATQTSVINDGALLYLSERTVNSQLARLYLFGEKNSYFRLVHSQDNEIVERIKASGASNSDFVYFGGLQGPIKIWQVSYPQGIQVNPDYLKPSYPNPNLSIAK